MNNHSFCASLALAAATLVAYRRAATETKFLFHRKPDNFKIFSGFHKKITFKTPNASLPSLPQGD